ncbi:MAG: transposase [Planctomycetaceae bacterium]|nr:transposase [Planctomycetaceae bacterium]
MNRKSPQPTTQQLRDFYRIAAPQLRYPILWFDPPDLHAIAEAFSTVIQGEKLTCYACAALRNHAHLLVRKHRLKYEEIAHRLKTASADVLRRRKDAALTHPIWSAESCSVYKDSVESMRTCIRYIDSNPPKHHLPAQQWEFVTPYDDWPFHRSR